ncbi:alginate export family protein [Flavobacterium faecale]|uniref:alginate export family protein n=1 Tax=Flavobacterium faecale TaxID=1355330 RepID=UPI003AAF68AE
MRINKIIFSIITLFTLNSITAQNSDDILNLLIQRKIIKQTEADSIRSHSKSNVAEQVKNKTFQVDLQIKNRGEYRHGYRNIPNDNSSAAVFINQRSRLNIDYKQGKSFNTLLSLQDARVWGSHDPRGLNGTIQLFEGYIEPFINPNLSIRIGRQRIAYDNQRFFAENEWRINGAAHDAINFRYYKKKLSTELVGAFNQTGERIFGTDYTPATLSITPANSTATTWTNYKALAIHYLKYNFNSKFTATSIIASDAYQDEVQKELNHWRFTYGGRLEVKNKNWYVTTTTYLQSGRNSTGKTIDAWYIQPEIKYSSNDQLSIRLGAEILSGDNGTVGQTDHNFVPLYGVAHRFNGFMDFFTRFPSDLNNAGLINPYLFFSKKVSKKLELHSNNHLFYTQRKFITSANQELKPFMGYEHDLLVTYKPNHFTNIESGFSVALPTDTMTTIKNFGNADNIATWAYIQVKFTPTLFKTRFN